MSGDNNAIPPPVLWAQRTNCVFLTICLEDCKNPDIKMENDKVIFNGVGGTEKKPHELTINLFKEIDPEKSAKFVRDRNIEIILKKKEEGPYWPHLTKEKEKHHWLKVDFDKWKDEDDSDDEFGSGQPDDLDEMVRSMGGLGGGAGMGKESLDDLDVEEPDSDDDLPDLE
ncbi:prostaglandin E synthase 3-like isoform X2 [Nilaparvata lugens]|uniref:prostaglandin E synthase 3 isoform X2 n=1 Tax=Nilaparvata lugens TaxID=108931 RepID=UPI000B98329E|nr:prostaglandin E synthase 3 isoform X2 [Nilaparvata lugens]XP_039300733.1 prostaglandin E synthase 3-like isoform X2 [Nilaparvata lugens]